MTLYLISYDVCTATKAGATRLRRVARHCENYGIRVQNSVFECEMSHEVYLQMKQGLIDLISPQEDSIRIYPMGKHGRERVVHLGVDRGIDLEAPLVF